MVPWTGSVPRRARHLIPTGLPRRGEVLAVCAVAILVAHLLLAQLTLVLAVGFAVVAVASRWRLWWLLAPAAAGLAWTLAIGPDEALAGLTAGPSSILWHLGGGHLAGEIGHPFAGFGNAQNWLPRQFPVALIGGAAEAALVGWLDWLHTDEWAVPPPRPGLVAAARRALAARAIRSGAVVTREGCALGVVPSTGATAELSWAELAHGTLVVGASAQDVTLTGCQIVHAALRRRKPVIVLDLGDAAIARALVTACQATGTPLQASSTPEPAGYAVQVAGTAGAGVPGMGAVGVNDLGPGGTGAGAAGASQLWGRGTTRDPEPSDRETSGRRSISLPSAVPPGPTERATADPGRVVRERSAALLPAGSPELAARACADLAALATDLRRIGVDGDALVWVPHGERVPAQALAALLRDSPDAGLSVLIGTTSPAAATELGGLTGTTLIYRVTGRDLAASLATRTGTRLLPAPIAAAPPSFSIPPSFSPHTAAPAVSVSPAPDLVPSPVIPASTLPALGQAEFVLAASSPHQRSAVGRMVPARLPGRSG